jgi:hypothetical protein
LSFVQNGKIDAGVLRGSTPKKKYLARAFTSRGVEDLLPTLGGGCAAELEEAWIVQGLVRDDGSETRPT